MQFASSGLGSPASFAKIVLHFRNKDFRTNELYLML